MMEKESSFLTNSWLEKRSFTILTHRLFKEARSQASLDEISEGLAIPKYGAGSAYDLL
jgi:hypothetical protein